MPKNRMPLKPHLKAKTKVKLTTLPFWQADKPYMLSSANVTDASFRRLAYVMTFLAGGINAGGFFAVARYTSHVTGSLSLSADMIYVGNWEEVIVAMVCVVSFILGSAHSSWVILWAKRQRFHSGYGLSMWAESLYLLVFALMGTYLTEFRDVFVPLTLVSLCFIMGMHNTVMSLLSGGSIRSTHMTGTATDLGIELAKVFYYNHSQHPRLPNVRVNRPKMNMLVMLLVLFVAGGLVGVWGYHKVGYYFTLPMAIILFLFGVSSVSYDLKIRTRILLRARSRAKRQTQSSSTTKSD